MTSNGVRSPERARGGGTYLELAVLKEQSAANQMEPSLETAVRGALQAWAGVNLRDAKGVGFVFQPELGALALEASRLGRITCEAIVDVVPSTRVVESLDDRGKTSDLSHMLLG